MIQEQKKKENEGHEYDMKNEISPCPKNQD
jgi:hypothetical protein